MSIGVDGIPLFTTHDYSLLMDWLGGGYPHDKIENLRLIAMMPEEASASAVKRELKALLKAKPPKLIHRILSDAIATLTEDGIK